MTDFRSHNFKPLVLVSICIVAMTLAGCSRHEIDTFEAYCESIAGIDLQQKYQPIWAGYFIVSYEGEAIRSDYAKFLNAAYMREVTGRVERMVWRDRKTLHLTNRSGLFQIAPSEFLQEWRLGIQRFVRNELADDADKCLYGTAAQLFDEIEIHSLSSSIGLSLDKDHVTTIATERRKHFDWVPD